jgi:hypothetical protein
MSKPEGHEAARHRRIVKIASQVVAAQLERGEIPETDEAIRAAMLLAMEDAKQIVDGIDR